MAFDLHRALSLGRRTARLIGALRDDARPRRFTARASREDHAAELMHEVLGQAADRQAVLARFVGSVNDDEARLLRELLAGHGR